MVDGNVGLKEQKDENRSIYITSQTGLCDENELFINRSRCYATVPLIDNAIAGCVGTGLGRVVAA
jgi:hypothetical protein